LSRTGALSSSFVTSTQELQAQTDAHYWFHTIDLGNGVVTKGAGIPAYTTEIFPEFTGRSVLDIGAWDGYYSFQAEKRGAARVVALDHYAWGIDFGARSRYWNECIAKGVLPDHTRDLKDFWQPELPGRRSFDFARATLGSSVESVVADFATTDLEALGVFDIVLYLGVLYHMEEPLTCLKRVRSVTTEVAVIETEAVHIEHYDDGPLLQFHAGDTLRADFGNWYVPTIRGLHALCLAAGFSSVRTVAGPPEAPQPIPESLRRRLGRKIAVLPRPTHVSAPSANYRAVVHAFV
jgi:tRNA (mo5U34)-methyltransferase